MEYATWQALILTLLFSGFVIWKIASARRGKEIFIRAIPGLKAIDEAVGRAAELGTPVVFSCGISSFTDIQTLAALGILQHVCTLAAKFRVPVIVTTNQPVMIPICEDTMRSAFESVDCGDMMGFSEVRLVSMTPANDLLALGTVQILLDKKVASMFLFGAFDYTSLLYSEGGQIAGCMQIAGTADYYQVPFFIASCDYVVMAEELFACSAYLSRQPNMLGSVVGQDYGKLTLLTLIAVGVISVSVFGINNPLNLIVRLFSGS